ncbi:hypothetical protein FKM82_003390 [Ascaphus truei]
MPGRSWVQSLGTKVEGQVCNLKTEITCGSQVAELTEEKTGSVSQSLSLSLILPTASLSEGSSVLVWVSLVTGLSSLSGQPGR